MNKLLNLKFCKSKFLSFKTFQYHVYVNKTKIIILEKQIKENSKRIQNEIKGIKKMLKN